MEQLQSITEKCRKMLMVIWLREMGKESGKCGRGSWEKTSLIYKDGTRNWNIADPYPMDIISDGRRQHS